MASRENVSMAPSWMPFIPRVKLELLRNPEMAEKPQPRPRTPTGMPEGYKPPPRPALRRFERRAGTQHDELTLARLSSLSKLAAGDNDGDDGDGEYTPRSSELEYEKQLVDAERRQAATLEKAQKRAAREMTKQAEARKRQLAEQMRLAAVAAKAAAALRRNKKEKEMVNSRLKFDLRKASLEGRARSSESVRRADAADMLAPMKNLDAIVTADRAEPWGAPVASPVDAGGLRTAQTSGFVETGKLRRLASMESMEMRRHRIATPPLRKSCEPRVNIATVQVYQLPEPKRVFVANCIDNHRERTKSKVVQQHASSAASLAPRALDLATPAKRAQTASRASRPQSPYTPYTPPYAVHDDETGERKQRPRTEPLRRPQTASASMYSRATGDGAGGWQSPRGDVANSTSFVRRQARPFSPFSPPLSPGAPESLPPPEGFLSLTEPAATTWVWGDHDFYG